MHTHIKKHSYTFLLLVYKIFKYLWYILKFLFRQLMMPLTVRFFLDQPRNGWQGEKRGRQKYKNLFSDERKSIFHIFEGLSFGVK